MQKTKKKERLLSILNLYNIFLAKDYVEILFGKISPMIKSKTCMYLFLKFQKNIYLRRPLRKYWHIKQISYHFNYHNTDWISHVKFLLVEITMRIMISYYNLHGLFLCGKWARIWIDFDQIYYQQHKNYLSIALTNQNLHA